MRSPPTDVSCVHCGLPVPPRMRAAKADEPSFCCAGCRAVYGLLHEQQLTEYYALVDAEGAQPARPTGRSYSELDDERFQQKSCQAAPGGLQTTELYLEGVHCTACVWLVERLPSLLPGVVEARLDLGRSVARLTWIPTAVALSAVARQIDRLGYPVHPWRAAELQRLRRREDRTLLIRIAVAGAVAGNVMLMAAALYAGAFEGMGANEWQLFRWASMLVALPALLWSALPFFRGAWGALRARMLHMDLPVSIGLIAGYVGGAVNTVRGRGDIYFDSLTVLVFLLLVGRWLQQRQQRRAADAAELLCSMMPTSARVIGADDVHEVPLEAVLPGMRVEVRAGDSVPVDGRVVHGQSRVDAALLTGESRPRRVVEGDDIHAGTVNVGARLVVEVCSTGEETRVGKLMQRVAEYARRRARIVQLADRVAGYFVATTVTLSALTAVMWWHAGSAQALEHAMALLIVTCPCALGLATPLAVSVAIGRAARHEILIKGGDALERLARPATIVLDKTGTLTTGRTTVVDWYGDESVKPLVAQLERHSAHYLAQALVCAFGGNGATASTEEFDPDRWGDVRETPGAGIEGMIAGRRLVVGSARWFAERRFALPGWVGPSLERWASAALSPVLVAIDGEVVAAAALGDPLRPETRRTLQQLRARGFRLELLSGDYPPVVAAVARELGISADAARGAMSPEDKLEYVQGLAQRGPVVMVGDGVNDAAALAAATVGVAVHGGAEVSLEAADVYTAGGGLDRLITLVDGARQTLHVIRRNLVFSLLYNGIGASLAIAGYIHPLLAALLMPASSLTVVVSSFRGGAFSAPTPRQVAVETEADRLDEQARLLDRPA